MLVALDFEMMKLSICYENEVHKMQNRIVKLYVEDYYKFMSLIRSLSLLVVFITYKLFQRLCIQSYIKKKKTKENFKERENGIT